ncbi:uncharacterized protein LOC126370850 [Pectinophora gossypiella]|uniref:uncharacterized protein LOC126370850 n=1 Tax=Pectinophora gossypiella TaxID=13191 RepID=UPI00214E3001|nr:uncharacterized protein LOC126370850 [Pectinophora gossypiella]
MDSPDETDPLTKRTASNNENHKNNDTNDINKINSRKTDANTEIVAHYTRDDSPVDRVKFEGLDDKDSICSESTDDDKLPPIPDGGWGWVVVLSAFLVSAIADGLAFSFGLLHEEFTNYFNATQSQTSLIGSLFIATPLLAGPIMSALVDRFGCRIMTMIAGFASTIGFLLASVSNSIPMLCLTFGFLSGLAMGILYVTAVVSVAFWFDKRRNLAVSLASCGIGFGTLIYSPLTHFWLEFYGWRSTIILLAGTLLNVCVCGAVMRNPEWLEIKQKTERRLSKSRSRRSSSAGSVSSRSIGGESVFISPEELKSLLKSGKSPDYILATLTTTIAEAEELEATTQMNAETSFKRMHSAIHLPTFVQQNEKVPPEVIEKLMENKRLYNIILQNYPELITRRKSEVNLNIETPPADVVIEPAKLPVEIKIKNKDMQDAKDKGKKDETKDGRKDDAKKKDEMKVSRQDSRKEETGEKRERKESHKDKKHEHQKDHTGDGIKHEHDHTKHDHDQTRHKERSQPPPPVGWVRQISVDHHYFRDMPLYRNTMMHRGAMLNISRYKLRALSLPDMYRNSDWSIASSVEMDWWDRVLEVVKSTFDFRMFTEFHFLMFNVSSLILSIWFIVPYFFLKSFMTEMNVEGGEIMNGVIGVASSIGIVALGWAGDQPWMNVIKSYAACLIICGLSVAAYPLFITSYWSLGVISAIFGLSFASSYSYTPAILMELMPIDHFTVAYGLILLSQGIGHLVGPPIGGLLYDLTGSWNLTFYMGGIWLVISGLCVGVIAYTKDARMCGSAPLLKEAEEAEKNGNKEVDV